MAGVGVRAATGGWIDDGAAALPRRRGRGGSRGRHHHAPRGDAAPGPARRHRRRRDRAAERAGGAAAAAAAAARRARAAKAADGAVTEWAPVATEAITFAGPRNPLLGAWAPAAEARGSVLVVHENRGLTDHIRSVASRLAACGYSALAIDLLSAEGGTGALPGRGGGLRRAQPAVGDARAVRRRHAGRHHGAAQPGPGPRRGRHRLLLRRRDGLAAARRGRPPARGGGALLRAVPRRRERRRLARRGAGRLRQRRHAGQRDPRGGAGRARGGGAAPRDPDPRPRPTTRSSTTRARASTPPPRPRPTGACSAGSTATSRPRASELAPRELEARLDCALEPAAAVPARAVDALGGVEVELELLAQLAREALGGHAQRRLVVQLERAVVEVDRPHGGPAPSTVMDFACSMVGWYSYISTPAASRSS